MRARCFMAFVPEEYSRSPPQSPPSAIQRADGGRFIDQGHHEHMGKNKVNSRMGRIRMEQFSRGKVPRDN